MIEKANAILAQTEPAHAESLKRLDILTAQSVLLVKDETAKAGELEEAKAWLTSTLALAEDGLRGQALATVEAERDKELSVLESKLKSYISRWFLYLCVYFEWKCILCMMFWQLLYTFAKNQ